MTRLINPLQNNFVRYFLYYNDNKDPILEPENWNQAGREYNRSKQYSGILIALSDDILFSGSAAATLNDIYEELRIAAEVFIGEERKNEITDEWEDFFFGQLDFGTAKRSADEFSCKINSDVLSKKFTSRWRTELDISKKNDLDGVEHGLPPVEKQSIELPDRILEGYSTLDIGTAYYGYWDNSVVLFTNKGDAFYDLPLVRTIEKEKFDNNDPLIGVVENMFFIQRQQKDIEVTFSISLKSVVKPIFVAPFTVDFYFAEYEERNSQTEVVFDRVSLDLLGSFTAQSGERKEFNLNTKFTKTVKTGRAFSFYYNSNNGLLPNPIGIDAASIDIVGNTFADGSRNDVFMPFPFFERFIKLMSGGRLESEYLQTCRYSIANGFMIRNAKNPETNEDLPTTFTFQKLYNSFDFITPIGLSIKSNTVIIEKREYFYQKFVSYDFGADISNVEFEYDKENGFSEVNIGFETSNFSKEDALDEFAVRTVWTTPINSYRKVLSMVSNIQASSYVIEKLRRIQYNKDVDRTHSRRGDSTIFFIDLKDDEFVIRDWEDDFAAPPINLKNALEAYNLRLSPMNRLRSLGKWISYAYTGFKDRDFVFASSTGNTEMITQPIGKTPIGEQDNLPIKEAGAPRFVNEKVTFRIKPMNFIKILNQEIDGVSKMYGLFGFRYNGKILKGYLVSYKPDNFEVELQLEF